MLANLILFVCAYFTDQSLFLKTYKEISHF